MILVELFIVLILALGVAFVVHGVNRWFCERYDSESAVSIPWRMMLPIVSSCMYKGVETRERRAANERFLLELFMIVSVLLAYARFGLGWHSVILIGFFGFFAVAGMTVTKYGVIPDLVSGGIALLGALFIVSNLVWAEGTFVIAQLDHVVGAAAGIMVALVFLIKRLEKAQFTQSGAPKIMAATGLLLGWQLLALGVLLAMLLHLVAKLLFTMISLKNTEYRYHVALAALLGLTFASLLNAPFIAWVIAFLG